MPRVTGIQPIRHQDRVDVEVTFDDGTNCTYIPGKPGDILSGIVAGETLTSEMRKLAAAAGEKWIADNPDKIAELLAR